MSMRNRVSEIGTVAALPSDRRRDDYDEGDEIDVREYVLALWRHRVAIVTGTLAAAIVALAVGLIMPRTYSAEAVLVIHQSKLLTAAQIVPLTTASYRPILESPNLATTVVREFGLDRRGVSATDFFSSVVTIDEVRNSTVFILKAALDDANLAARVANRTAELAVEEFRRLNQDEAFGSRDNIKTQFDEAQARMLQAEAQVLAFKNSSQIELLRNDVNAALQQRGGLLALLVQIEAEKARLAKAEAELAARQRIDTVKRSIDKAPALLEAARNPTREAGDLLSLQLSDESINSVYQQLDSQIAASRTALAALQRQKEQVVDVRKLDAPQLGQLTRLYDAESRLARLQVELDLARRVYDQIATAYQTARLQVAGRSAGLQMLEMALPPDRPMSRHIVRNTGIALVLGLFLSSVFALVYDAFAASKRSATV